MVCRVKARWYKVIARIKVLSQNNAEGTPEDSVQGRGGGAPFGGSSKGNPAIHKDKAFPRGIPPRHMFYRFYGSPYFFDVDVLT